MKILAKQTVGHYPHFTLQPFTQILEQQHADGHSKEKGA
jgi:hypothetical protein